ncbi:MAG: hypothetical protein ACYC5F_02615 [Thermoleophilia bacterium]
MNTELEITEKPSFLKSRFLLNMVWLLALVATSFMYDQLLSRIQVTRGVILTIPWYKGYIIEYLPFLAIQGILQWFALKHFYPRQRLGNTIWILVMPFLFLIGDGLLALAIYVLAARSGVLH